MVPPLRIRLTALRMRLTALQPKRKLARIQTAYRLGPEEYKRGNEQSSAAEILAN